MKKLFRTLIVAGSLMLGVGLSSPTTSVITFAEGEPTTTEVETPTTSEEVPPITSEEPQTSEEEEGFYDTMSQVAKDIIAVLKEPIVIAGTSITIGSILLFAIGFVIKSASKGKIKSVKEMVEVLQNSFETGDKALKSVKQECDTIYECLKAMLPSVKNEEVKKTITALLERYENANKVLEDKKVEIENETKSIEEIIKE